MAEMGPPDHAGIGAPYPEQTARRAGCLPLWLLPLLLLAAWRLTT